MALSLMQRNLLLPISGNSGNHLEIAHSCCRGFRFDVSSCELNSKFSRSFSSTSICYKKSETDHHHSVAYNKLHVSPAKHGSFVQPAPQLYNPYSEDPVLGRYLKRFIPDEHYSQIESDLHHFGDRIVDELDALALQCDQNLPQLTQYDAWGRRVDQLETSAAWKAMKRISAEEGLVAAGYETQFGQWRRLHQMAKLFLYTPSAGLYSCPLAMTDGAAKLIKEENLQPQTGDALERLTSRDPSRFWTSGQWMTEKKGGSDVGSGTETLAFEQPDGTFKLHGYKWFSSATDSDMTFTLGRVVPPDGEAIKGSGGLSLFFVKTVNESTNSLNGIQIVRLKNKLGTRQVPTAELLLDGAVAVKVSLEGKGVRGISHMLNTTRLHNAISSAGAMRRIVNLARDYMHKREVFGLKLVDLPLHVQTLAKMEVETRGCTLMCLDTARLLGVVEEGASGKDAAMLRLMGSLVKLYTAKQAVATVSEGLESFGGIGYMEDSGLPVMLRDAQVLPIWEGTTNVLSMDLLRHLGKTGDRTMKEILNDYISGKLKKGSSHTDLSESCKLVIQNLRNCETFVESSPDLLTVAARDFAFSLARVIGASLLIEQASSCGFDVNDIQAVNRWCNDQPMCQLRDPAFYETALSADRNMMTS